MAKTTNWTAGANTGDWDTVPNWSNGLPDDGDTVTMLASASQGPSLNMDRTGDNGGDGLNLALLIVEWGVKYDIGSSGSPLRCRATKIVHYGFSTFYFKTDGTTATTALIVVLSNHKNALVLDGKSSGGVVTTLAAFGGGIRIKSSMEDRAIGNCYVSLSAGLRSPTIVAEAGGEASAGLFGGDVHVVNGSVIDGRGHDAILIVCGGVYSNNKTITTESILLSGVINFNDSSTEAVIVHLGGTLDLLRENTGLAKTIGTYVRNRTEVDFMYDASVHTFTDPLLI